MIAFLVKHGLRWRTRAAGSGIPLPRSTWQAVAHGEIVLLYLCSYLKTCVIPCHVSASGKLFVLCVVLGLVLVLFVRAQGVAQALVFRCPWQW